MAFFPSQYFVSETVQDGFVELLRGSPDRIYAQYRNKPKAVAWYSITKRLADMIADTALAVRIMYDIDHAQGEQLNIIGRIVGIGREYATNVALYPGLFSDPDGDEFGDSSAMFSALSIDDDRNMSDEVYRLIIKSKIIKNNSQTTIEDILYGMNFLLPQAAIVRVMDNEDMSFSVEFFSNISEIQRWAILNADLVPKPQGVKFNGFLEGVGYVQFNNDQLQFGDTNSQFVGLTEVQNGA